MGPLQDIIVVDLSRALAGPYCTLMLGDMGAEVIKLELPGSGDDSRGWGPPFLAGESSYFLSVNRNKKSVTLNLKSSEGLAILRQLVQRADVLVENFRPGTMERLGLGYEQAHRLNPRLVYCSISGFGQTGPRSRQPAFDQVLQGMGGIMSLTGLPGGTPIRVGIPVADLAAGMFSAFAVVSALYHCALTGEGQWIDASLLGGQVAMLTYQAGRYFATGQAPGRGGNRHASIAPYEVFATRDGYVNVACGTEGMWQRLCPALDLPELLGDPRFRTNADRVQQRDALSALLQARFQALTTAEAVDLLERAEVPVGPVYDLADLFADPQTRHLELRRSVQHPTAGEIQLTGFPFQMSATPPEVRQAPPLLGQHTDEMLARLGYSGPEIAALREQSVV
ncbi:MAG: CoA transferase [Chloroflexi bacterium]|nr:CoA transferase [Chloroflexota bacterium]